MARLGRVYDDNINRMSTEFTAYALGIFALWTFGANLFGTSIYCDHPFPEYPSHYFDSDCLYSQLKRVPEFNSSTPLTHEVAISYYPWISAYLVVAMIGFILPRRIWIGYQRMAGVDFEDYAEKIKNIRLLEGEARKSSVAKFIYSVLQSRRTYFLLAFGRMWVKMAYIMVAALQLIVLAGIFEHDLERGAWLRILRKNLWNGVDSHNWDIFPYMTMCTVTAKDRTETFECDLPYNKYYGVLIFGLDHWYFFLMLITTIDLVFITYTTFSRRHAARFLAHLLKEEPKCYEGFKEMVYWYLQYDGVVVFKFLAKMDQKIAEEAAMLLYEDFLTLDTPILKNLDECELIEPRVSDFFSAFYPSC